LFRPFRIKSLDLKNRIVMAPMTRSFSPGGTPGQNVADYYRRRAESDVGLILSEGTVIDRPTASDDPKVPVFHGAEPLAGWRRVIEGVHAAGGRMGPQLWHVGAASAANGPWLATAPAESPSGLMGPNIPNGEAMSEEAIADTIDAFGRAAADAKRLGFDTVEIHAAHGYLIDQFFWSGSNLRTDRYGGRTLAERTGFAVEVIRRVRAAVGPDFPILLRFSQWKGVAFDARPAPNPAELEAWLAPLVEAGVDVLHASQRRFWEAEFPDVDGENGLNLAGWAKKLTGAASITVGSVGLSADLFAMYCDATAEPTSLEGLVRRLEREEFDLVAVGRALLNDPQWAAKVRTGAHDELTTFDRAKMGVLV
jgi:2,4-dienoyl-CoA reductase-like NADH-dependent reductase (Old Yellow Enzyme family)